MSKHTPNHERCWWGWGLAKESEKFAQFAINSGVKLELHPPDVSKLSLPTPKISISDLPASLRHKADASNFERMLHSRGRSFEDVLRNLTGDVSNVTDLVVFPTDERDVMELLKFCSERKIACFVFGGGSSVVGGVEPSHAQSFNGCITLDLKYLDKLLEVDHKSLSIRVQGGMLGPALEQALKPHNLTLRHFPQSFEFSSVGGWVATRAGGHFATHTTHIDDVVEAVRMVCPLGVVVQTRRLPASGAGPSEKAHYVGSEGVYGVITEVWLRVRERPRFRASAVATFSGENSFFKGSECVRHIVQSGLQPANCRLIDGNEFNLSAQLPAVSMATATNTQRNQNPPAVLVLGFESAHFAVDSEMDNALRICAEHNAEGPDVTAWKAKQQPQQQQQQQQPQQLKERSGLAQSWGEFFMRGGYARDVACRAGLLCETFETAITWDKFHKFHNAILRVVKGKMSMPPICDGNITARFTHVYPNGPAVYYTIIARVPQQKQLQRWKEIKRAVLATIVEEGGTCTHHHAVGTMHAEALSKECGGLFVESVQALKKIHDPCLVMNPGVLVSKL